MITNDDYRDLRAEFEFLQGCDRVLGFHFNDRTAVLQERRLEPISAFDISRAQEYALEVPRNLRNPTGRRLMEFEWSCAASDCSLAAQALLDVLPVNRGGAAHCPECGEPLERRGHAGYTVEAKLLVQQRVALRLPIGEGGSVVIGRGANEVVDVAGFVSTADSSRVSRRHVELHNRGGRLFAVDHGSRNGTRLRGVRLDTGIWTHIAPEETLEIVRGLEVRLSGKRYPRGGPRVTPGGAGASPDAGGTVSG